MWLRTVNSQALAFLLEGTRTSSRSADIPWRRVVDAGKFRDTSQKLIRRV